MLTRVNAARLAAGVPALVEDPVLDRAAQSYAALMAAKSWYSHTGPDGSTPVTRMQAAGAGPTSAWGENIAAGQPDAAQVMAAWMASPDHKANTLQPAFTRIGIGEGSGGQWGFYWVEDFAGPAQQAFAMPTITDPLGNVVTHAAAGTELWVQGPALGTPGILYFPSAGCAPIREWTPTRIRFTVPNRWSFTAASAFELWAGRPEGGLGIGSAYYLSPTQFTIDTVPPAWAADAALRDRFGDQSWWDRTQR